MNIRQKHMLNTLVNDGSIHIGTSAQKFNVGERTIRYDLDVIADYISTKLQHQGLMIKNNIAHLMINQDEIQDLRLEEMDNDYYEMHYVFLFLFDLIKTRYYELYIKEWKYDYRKNNDDTK